MVVVNGKESILHKLSHHFSLMSIEVICRYWASSQYLFSVVELVSLRRVAQRPAAQRLPANRAVRASRSAAARGGVVAARQPLPLDRYSSHYRFAKRVEERGRIQPESAFQFAELPGGSRPIHSQLVNTANLSVPKKSSPRSALAAWAKCFARATRDSIETSR